MKQRNHRFSYSSNIKIAKKPELLESNIVNTKSYIFKESLSPTVSYDGG